MWLNLLFSATLCKLSNYHKHSFFHHILTHLGHTCNVAAANLYCAVLMSSHYLNVVELQARDPTASLDPSEGVVAPPPVCLQGLGNGMECEKPWTVYSLIDSEATVCGQYTVII